MTYPISDVTRRIIYSGSAGTGPYSFSFEVLEQTDIAVYRNTTLLTLTTDYTVTINGSGTGSITLVVAATSADTVTLVGDRAIERNSDFVTGGDFFANTLNDELDSQTIFSQQIDEKANRSIKAPVTDPTTIDMTLPSKADRANSLLQFDLNGDPGVISNEDLVAGLARSVIGANYTITTATGDGATVVFAVAAAPGSKGNIQIFIDGAYQNKDGFSIAGTTVTFTEAPPLNSDIEFVVGYALGSYDGADDVVYTPAGTGAVATTVQSKLRESVSVFDFMTTAQIADVRANTASLDVRAACQEAIDAVVAAGGGAVYFPRGTYSLTSVASSDTTPNGLLVPHTADWSADTAVTLYGDGVDSVLLAGNTAMCVLRNSRVFTTIRNLRIDGGPKTQVTGLGVMPESTTQTTTITSQSNMIVENVTIENCRRGMQFQPGPTVTGSDSGCFYHSISDLFSNLNDEHVYMIGDVTASGNRTTRTMFKHCVFLRGNTGINLFKGTEIDFVSCNWELISDGTAPSTTPVAFYYGDGNPANINLIGGYSEACTRGVVAASDAIAVQMNLVGYVQSMANDTTVAFMNTIRTQNWVIAKALDTPASISLGDASFVALVADPAGGNVKLADMQVNGGSMQTWLAGTKIDMLYPTVMPVYTVATLPAAGASGVGARATVSDATTTTFATNVAGGGANLVPVYSTGSVWQIG